MKSAESKIIKGLVIKFENEKLIPDLFGEYDGNLNRIEKLLNVDIRSRGKVLEIFGKNAELTHNVLNDLYRQLKKGFSVGFEEVDASIRMNNKINNEVDKSKLSDLLIKTIKKNIRPRTYSQINYVETLRKKELVFGIGPAGTGKTYLAVAYAVYMLEKGEVDKIVLSRPAVEAGERLGFLPGDMKEKVDPYLRPLYDALEDVLSTKKIERNLELGVIEIAPLAFMRGRTLSNSFVILDEAQNTSRMQMKMFLTRLGFNSRMVVTGDLTQIDLPLEEKSGLFEALKVTKNLYQAAQVIFKDVDVVRNPLVQKIVDAYGSFERSKK